MSLHNPEINGVLPLGSWPVRGSTSSDAQNGSSQPQQCKTQFASDPLDGIAVGCTLLVS